MNFGGPIDMTPFGAVLSGIGILYWLLALGATAIAFWRPRRWWVKLPLAALVLAAFVYPVARHVQTKQLEHDAARARLDKAIALFQERCKTAGETITRTVENVEGVVWMKWRSEFRDDQQFAVDDYYGRDCGAEECIKTLLRVTSGHALNPDLAKAYTTGYDFVETTDPRDGKRYRYVAGIATVKQRTPDEIEQYKKNSKGVDPGPNVYGHALNREPIDAYSAKYGIAWNDISTREDRERWIAGGSLKLVDLQSGEVVAERRGYLVDTGQGSATGFRRAWEWAWFYGLRCPRGHERTWEFATRVLKPSKQGE